MDPLVQTPSAPVPANPETSQSNSEHSADTLPHEVSVNAVSVKPPPFWREMPALWFSQLEAQFTLAGISVDNTKYSHVIASLDQAVIKVVSDIVMSPPTTSKYEVLKSALIERLSASEANKLNQLLGDMELGDRKPSQLLRELRQLAGANIGEEFLRSLWLKRLPDNTQAILACTTGSLDQLASCADKIPEVACRPAISSVTALPSSSSFSPSSEIALLTQRVDSLSQQIAKLSMPRGRSISRRRTLTRNNSQSSRHLLVPLSIWHQGTEVYSAL